MSYSDNEFVNINTGELIDIGDYVKKETLQRKKEGYSKKLDMYNNPFYWGNMPNIKILLEQNKIKLSTLGAILILGCYINGDDTLICKANKDKTPLRTKQIMNNVLKMPPATFKRFISECKKSKILIVEGRGDKAEYRLNKEFHFVGVQDNKKESSNMVRIYKDGIMSMYKGGLTLDEIGFLYLIIPYVNYDNCTLVDNPFTENEKPLSYRDLESLLGRSRATLSKYFDMTFEHDFGKARKKNIYKLNVFGNFKGGKGTVGKCVFCVNPLILRRCLKLKGSIGYEQLENMFKSVGKSIV